jgi:hypothetical protein
MKKIFHSILLIGMMVAFVAGCEKMQMQGAGTADDMKGTETTGEAAAADIPAPMTPGNVATIVVGETPFSVEIASTVEEKAHGLMDRESLPENAGMWFVFDSPVQDEFWMKDTLIPLDMIFVGEDMKVVHIHENAVPKSLVPIKPPVPYRYVLEVNGGKTAEHGIKVGDSVERRIGPSND